MDVGIVGLGLIGGSLAYDLKRAYKDMKIVGFDHNKEHCIKSLELGIADKIVNDISEFKNLDLIFLAIPVDGIISVLQGLNNINKKTTIIDLGSTKEKIISAVPPSIRKNFVAAHPMAGTEKSGPTAAKKDLYHGKTVVLCNIEDSGDIHANLAKDVFEKIGMKIFYMDAKEHDKHAAYISHMPHAMSFALANSVIKQENPKAIVALAGGGFKDMSRIAKSSPDMWTDVFRQNKKYLLNAIKSFESEFSDCKKMIEDEKWDDLHEWMASANRLHKIL